MTDGTGTTTYTYDAMGDVTSQAFSAASGSGLSSNTISYSYFTTGLLASVAYPPYGNYFSSPTVTYTYDALGNMASETDWLGNKVSFAHDGDGNLTAQDNEVSSSYPNGTSGTTYAYDGADLNATATSSLAQTCGGQESLTAVVRGLGRLAQRRRRGDRGLRDLHRLVLGPGLLRAQLLLRSRRTGRLPGIRGAGLEREQLRLQRGRGPDEDLEPCLERGQLRHLQPDAQLGRGGDHPDAHAGTGGANTTYGYDAIGDLTSSTSAAATTSYSYDSIGQMTGMIDAAGTSDYEYTGDGLEAAASGEAVSPAGERCRTSTGRSASTACRAPARASVPPSTPTATRSSTTGQAGRQPKDIDGKIGLMAVSCPTRRRRGAWRSTPQATTSPTLATASRTHGAVRSPSTPRVRPCLCPVPLRRGAWRSTSLATP